MAAAGAVRAQLPDKSPSLDSQACPQHKRPEHTRTCTPSTKNTPQWLQGIAAKQFHQVSSHPFLYLTQNDNKLITFGRGSLCFSQMSEQLSVWLSVGEHPQPRSLQQPQQQQPDAFSEDAQLPELYLRLSPGPSSHAAQQHTHRWTWRQQNTRSCQR